MAIRLREFAELHRISERTVQKQIKENFDVLGEHIDRRGKQGTWLDDYAVEFLLEAIQLPTAKDTVMTLTPREAALMAQIQEMTLKYADAERRAGANAEAAGKVALLEQRAASQEAHIADLRAENDRERARAQKAEKNAQETAQELLRTQERLAKAESLKWYELIFKKKEK